MQPLAYHLIWTTYGTWLPGDARGWIQSGAPGVQPPDPERERAARGLMAETFVVLTKEQRTLVEQTIREHCAIRRWSLHALNVRSNHVHVVLTTERDATEAMNQLKLWSSRRLSDLAGLRESVARGAGRRRWWTEGGDKLPIWDDEYFANAVQYVAELQGE